MLDNENLRSMLYRRWINSLHDGVNIGDVLQSANISHVWIYGDGEICSMLIDEIKSNVIIKGIVVKKRLAGRDEFKGIRISSIEEICKEEVREDTILVTPLNGFDTIQADLINVFDRKRILHISGLIYNPPILINIETKNYGEKDYCLNVCTGVLDVNKKIIVYDFGVGENVSFDKELADDYIDSDIYMFDPTPRAKEYVKTINNFNFCFEEYGLSGAKEEKMFFLPKNKENVSGSEKLYDGLSTEDTIVVQMDTLKNIMDQNGHSELDILKMNIEGSEFFAIPQLLDDGCRPKQICVGTHRSFFANGDELYCHMMRCLNEAGYWPVWVSEDGDDYCFVRGDLMDSITTF